MEKVSLRTLAAWCGGVLDGEDVMITDICRNTQALTKGCLFTPMIGERTDGHRYIDDAIRLGAAATLCAHDDLHPACPVIRVDDTLKAAQKIAAAYRRERDIKLVGVTGSVGKTTTGRMLGGIVSRRFRMLKTEDDMNGQIGLTYAMFRLENSHEAAVMEMGMSRYGELSRLTAIANPDVAVINSIGTAHIEFFGTRENILKAKLEIMEGLKPDGTAVLCGDEPLLWNIRNEIKQRVLTYGIDNRDADVVGEVLEASAAAQTICVTGLGRTFTVDLPVGGIHNARNALAACTAAMVLGIDDADIIAGLASYESAKGRQRIFTHNGHTLIDDCYNASPDSVKAALAVLASIDAPKHIAVLGGMLELGDYSETGHLACGKAAAQYASDLLCYGNGSDWYRAGALEAGMNDADIHVFDDHASMASYLRTIAGENAAVLFKGSRGMKIEEVLNRFLEEENG